MTDIVLLRLGLAGEFTDIVLICVWYCIAATRLGRWIHWYCISMCLCPREGGLKMSLSVKSTVVDSSANCEPVEFLLSRLTFSLVYFLCTRCYISLCLDIYRNTYLVISHEGAEGHLLGHWCDTVTLYKFFTFCLTVRSEADVCEWLVWFNGLVVRASDLWVSILLVLLPGSDRLWASASVPKQ